MHRKGNVFEDYSKTNLDRNLIFEIAEEESFLFKKKVRHSQSFSKTCDSEEF